MFPKIPDTWKALGHTELFALATEIRTAFEAFNASEDPEKDFAEARKMVDLRKEIIAVARAKEALANEQMSEDDEAPAPVVEASDDSDAGDDDDAGDDAGDDAADDDADDEAGAPEVTAGTKAPVKVKTTTGVGGQLATPGSSDGKFTPDKLIATGGASGKAAGDSFGSWLELAETLCDVGKDLSPQSNQKFTIAKVVGNFDEAHTLSENYTDNLRKFDTEIMAAMCAPAQPVYDLDCWLTDRRPVRGSLQSFKPDARGAVTIYPSPTLADVTGQNKGVGIWDINDDESQTGTDPSVKECAVIECANPTLYRLYGIWRCLTVQNLLFMTFPELVEAYLNRLAAWHSRVAEVALLESLATAATPVTNSDLGYGGSVSITTTVLQMLALHEEQERWDSQGMDAWVPRWVLNAMKIDQARRRNSSGAPLRVPSTAEIEAQFMNAGVDVNWFIDTPTWAAAVPDVENGGVLNALPNEVNMVVAPKGKFAVMDRGELSIGVTGNGMYRDNNSNAHNNFTFFFENFEALVNTNSCPAYLLSIEDLCWNGVQIDDVTLDCLGEATGS